MPLRNQPAENHRHSGKYISEVLRNEHLIAKLWRYWYKNKYFNKRYTPPFKYSVVNVLLSAPTHKSLTGYRVFTFKLSRPGVLRLLLLSEVLMPAWDVTTQHPALRSRRAGIIFLKFPRLYKRCDHFAFSCPPITPPHARRRSSISVQLRCREKMEATCEMSCGTKNVRWSEVLLGDAKDNFRFLSMVLQLLA